MAQSFLFLLQKYTYTAVDAALRGAVLPTPHTGTGYGSSGQAAVCAKVNDSKIPSN